MITYSKKDVKNLDKILAFLFNKQNKLSIFEDTLGHDIDDISVTSDEVKKELPFNQEALNKYFQILYNRNQNTGNKFIEIKQDLNKIWLLDSGIEFYYLGGFTKERKQQLIKRNYEIASIIFGIIASLGVLLSLYLNVIDTNRLQKRIEKIERVLDQ